jgi:membrane protease YdiL (CAAX protease family)
LSAGFCEEVAFRGYLQRQMHAMTGSAALAVLIQAAVFAIGHAYEGAAAVARIAMYAVLFGAVAAWRRSLRPGILAHAWSDLYPILFR